MIKNVKRKSDVLHYEPSEFQSPTGPVLANTDLNRFCLTRIPSEDDLDKLFDTFEKKVLNVFWEQQLVLDSRSGIPKLFRYYDDPSKGARTGRFYTLQKTPVSDALIKMGFDSSISKDRSATASAVFNMGKDDRDQLITQLKPKTFSEARKIVHAAISYSFFTFDPKFFYSEFRLANDKECIAEFFEWLCTLSNHKTKNGYSQARIWEFFSVANHEGLLLLPFAIFDNSLPQRRETWGRQSGSQKYLSVLDKTAFYSEERKAMLKQFELHLANAPGKANRLRNTFSIILHTTTARSIDSLPIEFLADIRSNYLRHEAFSQKKPDSKTEAVYFLNTTYMLISIAIKEGYSEDKSDELPANISLLAPTITHARAGHLAKSSGTFAWMSVQANEYDQWSINFEKYVSSKRVQSKTNLVFIISIYADYLIATRPPIYTPSAVKRHDICRRRETNIDTTYLEYLNNRFPPQTRSISRAMGTLRDFFNWYIAESDESLIQPVYDYDIPSMPSFEGKTEKIALPARLLQLMRTVLTENDFEWSKSIQEDHIFNKWCPVRAVAMYTLLTIPIRTIQVRLLDSGEGDNEIYCPESNNFIINPEGTPDRQQGVLKNIYDSVTNRNFTGLYINTNKTKHLYSKGGDLGYTIPWENPELIKLLSMVIQWQRKENRVAGPRHVNDCTDRKLHCTDSMAPRIPPRYFLFRDPCTKDHADPISRARIESMFYMLLAECERRLREEGESITLITQWKELEEGRKPVRGIVTPHSLRVSGITAFAEAGVPLQVLTEFIAGHSTFVMNLYYQKFGAATITQIIENATKAIDGKAGMDAYLRFIDDNADAFLSDLENSSEIINNPLQQALTYQSTDAISNLAQHDQSFWNVDIDGICPNGRTLCGSGGPRIGTKGGTRSTPVEGGAGNCPRCRYWVTGPMFIFGQLIKANALLYQLHEKSNKLAVLEDELADLQDLENCKKGALKKLRTSIDVMSTDIVNGLHTWVKRFEYARQSVEILKSSNMDNESKLPLITKDTDHLELKLTESHPFDLTEVVTQACEVFPSVDAGTAPLRKAKAIDQLLDRNNLKPLLFGLPDEMALRVGNQLTKFLHLNLKHDDVNNLISGNSTLESLGIEDRFKAALANIEKGEPAIGSDESESKLSHENPLTIKLNTNDDGS